MQNQDVNLPLSDSKAHYLQSGSGDFPDFDNNNHDLNGKSNTHERHLNCRPLYRVSLIVLELCL